MRREKEEEALERARAEKEKDKEAATTAIGKPNRGKEENKIGKNVGKYKRTPRAEGAVQAPLGVHVGAKRGLGT